MLQKQVPAGHTECSCMSRQACMGSHAPHAMVRLWRGPLTAGRAAEMDAMLTASPPAMTAGSTPVSSAVGAAAAGKTALAQPAAKPTGELADDLSSSSVQTDVTGDNRSDACTSMLCDSFNEASCKDVGLHALHDIEGEGTEITSGQQQALNLWKGVRERDQRG